jgi:hypothetical protein
MRRAVNKNAAKVTMAAVNRGMASLLGAQRGSPSFGSSLVAKKNIH